MERTQVMGSHEYSEAPLNLHQVETQNCLDNANDNDNYDDDDDDDNDDDDDDDDTVIIIKIIICNQ